MDLQISAENAQFLQDQVAAGSFPSPEAAVNAALDVLRRHTVIRDKVRRGCEQLERGEYLEFDDEGLDNYFQELFDIANSGQDS